MKATSFVVAAFVATLVIGCSSNSNPVQSDSQSAALQKNGVDDASALAAGSGRGGNNGETRIEGRVNAVDAAAGTITIGATIVQTNAATKIERNGFHVSLSSIQVGDRGQARIPVGGKVATKVESVG
jgi:hypothetical protein